ncbi:MAG: type II toxin-antitoxin system mRNA interferase toxin, RelE/StbE family [Bacteroidales bacterium]|nr:type II toxin-antitoxin system mRNA interferase toxin, RelE/StbE family [Bacteroidales bacterium]
MTVEFDKSFLKSLEKIKDQQLFAKIRKVIEEAEKATELKNLKQVKKLTGFKSYYRIRLGDYRLGFEEIDSNSIRLIIILHRKAFYQKFP